MRGAFRMAAHRAEPMGLVTATPIPPVQMSASALSTFRTHGFALVPQAVDQPACEALAAACAGVDSRSGGSRNMLQQPWCTTLTERLRQHPAIAACLPQGAVAVQCTYFEKTADRNWLVAMHQDLSVPVARPESAPGWHGWAQKEGHWFVQPPAAWVAQLVAVRLHLDACGPEDGPLRVIAGSHAGGRLEAAAIAGLRQSQPEVICTAAAGTALLMHPLLLHASSKSTGTGRRRVLHFLFAPPKLPFELQWQDSV